MVNPIRRLSAKLSTINSKHYQLRSLLHINRGAVAQNLADSGRNLRRIVTDANYRIGAQLPGVRDHLIESIFPRAFAQRGVKGDVPAEQALETRADVADNRAGTHDEAADHTERFDHAVARQFKRRGCERMCLAHNSHDIEHDSLPGEKGILERRCDQDAVNRKARPGSTTCGMGLPSPRVAAIVPGEVRRCY